MLSRRRGITESQRRKERGREEGELSKENTLSPGVGRLNFSTLVLPLSIELPA